MSFQNAPFAEFKASSEVEKMNRIKVSDSIQRDTI